MVFRPIPSRKKRSAIGDRFPFLKTILWIDNFKEITLDNEKTGPDRITTKVLRKKLGAGYESESSSSDDEEN